MSEGLAIVGVGFSVACVPGKKNRESLPLAGEFFGKKILSIKIKCISNGR